MIILKLKQLGLIKDSELFFSYTNFFMSHKLTNKII